MQVFGKYRVLERIAQGGMGTLLRAHDSVLDRTVALKLLGGHGPTTDDVRARFFREARAGARLTHPNIVTVHDLGEVDGQLFIVMEFLDGEDLGRVIAERRRLTLDTRLDVMMQVCSGLAYAHRNGVVHRDLKPANILVTRTGQVKIVDFGIARLTRDETGLTQTGVMMGTLRYMAPEQGRGRADERSDIFSIGAVFHELLTLQPAFPGRDGMEILEALRTHEPPPVDRLDPSIPPEVAAVVTDMLRKDPADRPASVAHVEARLRDIRQRLGAPREPSLTDDTVRIRPATGDPRAPEPPRRHARSVVLWAGVGAAALAVGVAAYWLWPVSRGPRDSSVAAVTTTPWGDVRPAPQPLPRDPTSPPAVLPGREAPPLAVAPRPGTPVAPTVSSPPERPRGEEPGSRRGEREARESVRTPAAPARVDPPAASRPLTPAPAAPSAARAPTTPPPAAPTVTSPSAPTAPRSTSPSSSSVSPPSGVEAPRSAPSPEIRSDPAPPSSGASGAPAQPPALPAAPAQPAAVAPPPAEPPTATPPRPPAVAAKPPEPVPARPAPEPARDPAVAAVAGTWKGLMSTRLSEAAVELSVAPDESGPTVALLIHSARNLGAGAIGFHESYAIARHAWPKPLARVRVDGRRLRGQDADALFALDVELSRDQQNLEGTLTAEGTVYSVHLRRR